MENGLAGQPASVHFISSARHHRVVETDEQGMTPALKEPHILGGEASTELWSCKTGDSASLEPTVQKSKYTS